MLPQEQLKLLQKKPDDRYDTLIGVLLSLVMVASVWHYAIKPGTTHTFAMSPNVKTVAVAAPLPTEISLRAETPLPAISVPLVANSQPLILAAPQQVIIAKPPHVIVQPSKSQVIAHPVIATIKVKPKPVVIVAPPPSVVTIAKPETIKPAISAAPPPVLPPVAPKLIIRESIEFANGSARLPTAATPRLLEIAELLKNDTRNLKIVGHTDNIGSAHDNHVLSLKRAKAVMRFLVISGIPAEHLTAEGAGSDFPLADNTTEEGRTHNRRIELTE